MSRHILPARQHSNFETISESPAKRHSFRPLTFYIGSQVFIAGLWPYAVSKIRQDAAVSLCLALPLTRRMPETVLRNLHNQSVRFHQHNVVRGPLGCLSQLEYNVDRLERNKMLGNAWPKCFEDRIAESISRVN